MSQTFYLCRACPHPDNLHESIGSRRCTVARDGCTCTAFQAPRDFGEDGRNARLIQVAIEDLARLGSEVDDPAQLAGIVLRLAGRLVSRRYAAAGKPTFGGNEQWMRLATTQLLHSVLAELWRGHESDADGEPTGFIRTYEETVLAWPDGLRAP